MMTSMGRRAALGLVAATTITLTTMAGGVAANAAENRYFGARYCEGNVASYMRTNASNWVDIYQVGGGVSGEDAYQFDTVWRARTFYSDVKNSSSQYQGTASTFSSAYIFCDN